MHKHGKKMAAPIVITVILLSYIVFFFILCAVAPIPFLAKLLGLLIPLGFGGVAVFCLVERAKEIGSGEEDDLSNY